jgi:hypothetical protein
LTQNLSALVMNAKLERPLDSHAPQTEQLYTYEDDNWGETLEDEYEDQWETSDEQYHDAQENFTAEVNEDDDNMGDENESHDSHNGYELMKMTKIDMCDIRIICKVWTHTYRRHRLCHVRAWMN